MNCAQHRERSITTRRMTRVTQLVDGRTDVHVGGPMHALSGLALGAQGFFSTEGAIAPKLCASVINNFAAGDQAATFAAFQRLMHLSAINVWPGGSVRYIKSALRVLGQPGWHTRPPYLPLDESLDDHIRAADQGARNPGVRGPRIRLTRSRRPRLRVPGAGQALQ